MWLLKFFEKQEFEDMKIGTKEALVEWVIYNCETGTTHYTCGDVIFIQQNGVDIGSIGRVEQI